MTFPHPMPEENFDLALQILTLFAVAFFLILVHSMIVEHCVKQRVKGKRAWRFLEILAGYDREQRDT
jgi:hypothetical protein